MLETEQILLTATRDLPVSVALLYRSDVLLDLSKNSGTERVVDPAALGPISDDPCILQCLEMKTEPRLACLQDIGKLADALLAPGQALDNCQPCFIREGAKPTSSSFSVLQDRRHAFLYINKT